MGTRDVRVSGLHDEVRAGAGEHVPVAWVPKTQGLGDALEPMPGPAVHERDLEAQPGLRQHLSVERGTDGAEAEDAEPRAPWRASHRRSVRARDMWTSTPNAWPGGAIPPPDVRRSMKSPARGARSATFRHPCARGIAEATDPAEGGQALLVRTEVQG